MYHDGNISEFQFEISEDDLLSNTMSADKALSKKSFDGAGGKVNKDKWYMSPATVNAYYNPKVSRRLHDLPLNCQGFHAVKIINKFGA